MPLEAYHDMLPANVHVRDRKGERHADRRRQRHMYRRRREKGRENSHWHLKKNRKITEEQKSRLQVIELKKC